ncbi:MAG TPA: FkbM family methyltransferase [Candidatus Dormibacteraeota bacterium]|nr:FkbM family methyltransferase [Candidatus Dormibacteraeota bacterium]
MPMISYALNHEDVYLDRAFPRAHRGFYVDIGASDPVQHSVTKHFYDRGWSGVNVEPNAQLCERLRVARTRDVSVDVAISDEEGELPFFEFPESTSGISTFSGEHAARHRDAGFAPVERVVRTITLSQLCAEHVADREIDFMSIDVEGHERQVIQGGDWRRWRPRVLLVEAVLPLTTTPSHHEWEPMLLEMDYVLAVFDGINRAYVRADEGGLLEALRVPVNVLDDYVDHVTWKRIQDLTVLVEAQSGQIVAARAANEALTAQTRGFVEELKVLRARYERAERAASSLRSHHEEILRSAGDTERLIAALRAEVAEARARTEAAHRVLLELGPAGLGMARRVARLARSHPRASASMKQGLLAALRVRRALRDRGR